MTSLQDEIARIAALRGKPANYYTAPEAMTPERLSERVPAHVWANLFTMVPSQIPADLQHCDRLPQASRTFVKELPIPLNAAVYRSILTAANGSEDCVISLVQARIPGNVRNWLNKHYRNHPNVRKYL